MSSKLNEASADSVMQKPANGQVANDGTGMFDCYVHVMSISH